MWKGDIEAVFGRSELEVEIRAVVQVELSLGAWLDSGLDTDRGVVVL